MKSAALVLSWVAACGGSTPLENPVDAPIPIDAPISVDAPIPNVHWTWRFEDPNTHATAPCPDGVVKVDLMYASIHNADVTWENFPAAIASADCADGQLSTYIPPPSTSGTNNGQYDSWLAAKTANGTLYAVAFSTSGLAIFPTGNGYVHVHWIGSTGNPISCDGQEVIAISTGLDQLGLSVQQSAAIYPCNDGEGSLGLSPGQHDISVDIRRVGQGSLGHGRVPGVVVVSGAVTEMGTITVTRNGG